MWLSPLKQFTSHAIPLPHHTDPIERQVSDTASRKVRTDPATIAMAPVHEDSHRVSDGQSTCQEKPSGDLPQDHGKGAWCFLAAASIILQATWGFTISFGVFREYYFNNPPFAGIQSIAEIGVMSTGLIQALSPFLLRYLNGCAEKRKPLMWTGVVICVASSIGAAFATTPVQLIMTQGVLYGLGSGLLFAPSVSLVDEWFVQRRSLAYGIYFGASSLSAAILPPVLSVILDRYGPRTTLIGWGIFSGTLVSICLLCIRSRLRASNIPNPEAILYRFFTKPLFWLLAVSNILQATAQYLPAVYLPSYAVDMKATAQNGALLLTYYNLASVICQPFLGILADKRGVLLPMLLSTVITTVAVLLVWGFSHAYWSLAIVAILFGGFSGGYVVLRNQFATAIVGDLDHQHQELIVSGALMFLRGASSVGSGFIGTAVVSAGENSGIRPGYGAGKWRPLILTVGIIMGMSTVGGLGFLRRRGRKREARHGAEPG